MKGKKYILDEGQVCFIKDYMRSIVEDHEKVLKKYSGKKSHIDTANFFYKMAITILYSLKVEQEDV